MMPQRMFLLVTVMMIVTGISSSALADESVSAPNESLNFGPEGLTSPSSASDSPTTPNLPASRLQQLQQLQRSMPGGQRSMSSGQLNQLLGPGGSGQPSSMPQGADLQKLMQQGGGMPDLGQLQQLLQQLGSMTDTSNSGAGSHDGLPDFGKMGLPANIGDILKSAPESVKQINDKNKQLEQLLQSH